MSNAATQFISDVDRQLTCPNFIKKRFMRQLENEVGFYCEDHTDADADSLCDRFGSPEEVAMNFMSETSHRTIKRYNTSRKVLLYIVLGVLIPAVIFATALGVQTATVRQQIPNDDYVASITYESESNGFNIFPLRDLIFGVNGK